MVTKTLNSRPQLLIVEDDLDLSEMISSYFGAQNYDVETVAWASEALKLADTTQFDLMMLDIRLPDMDGFELCRKLREARKTKDTPIIFLTERRDRNDKLQGLELGVVDYITKPFDLQELGLRIRNAISRAAAPSATHKVTDLPEGKMVDEKLADLIKSDKAWALLTFSVPSLPLFREQYGFVAADDVLRALALMVINAVKEMGNPEDFVGHIGASDLVVITSDSAYMEIYDRVFKRIGQSRQYFYPHKDREKLDQAMDEKHLRFAGGRLPKPHDLPSDVTELKTLLLKSSVSD